MHLRPWSVPPVSKTRARQNETLRIFEIRPDGVSSWNTGQFRGILLGDLGPCHALRKYGIFHVIYWYL